MARGAELESTIQSRIIKRYTDDGWLVVKIGLCNMNGIPDLLCLKDSKALFIEVKRPGKKPRPIQEYRIKQLRERGFEVLVLTD